jgi:hypothetical protein
MGTSLLLIFEKRRDVAVAFNDIYDLNDVTHVAKQNYVIAVRRGPNIREKLGARATERSRQTPEMAAIVVELPDKTSRNVATSACKLNVVTDRREIIPRARQQPNAAH